MPRPVSAVSSATRETFVGVQQTLASLPFDPLIKLFSVPLCLLGRFSQLSEAPRP